MKATLLLAAALFPVLLPAAPAAPLKPVAANVAYGSQERQVLDIYAPAGRQGLPVVFWIHGGGWQTGDKSGVQLKPQAFVEAGFVFVATNYRLLPKVEMATIFADVAQSLGWVFKNIAQHGGDPQRILVMGHSAGAQLAALLCTDARYLKAAGVPFSSIKGCVPLDGDTYDIPAMIETAETRLRVHNMPMPTFGHRIKFGNTPALHREYSAVTHVARDRGTPPFLMLYVADHPDTSIQARRMEAVLKDAGVPVKGFAARETNHTRINAELGAPGDATTKVLFDFVAACLKP